MQAIGLTNTRKVRRAEMFGSVAGALRILGKNLVATTANDNGALNVWKDRDGIYRCKSYLHRNILESKNYSNLRLVRAWLKKWMLKIA